MFRIPWNTKLSDEQVVSVVDKSRHFLKYSRAGQETLRPVVNPQ